MKRVRNFFVVATVALLAGFFAGEFVGQPAWALASDCPNEVCVYDMEAGEYFCEISNQATRCWLGLEPQMWTCDTCWCGEVECEDPGPRD